MGLKPPGEEKNKRTVPHLSCPPLPAINSLPGRNKETKGGPLWGEAWLGALPHPACPPSSSIVGPNLCHFTIRYLDFCLTLCSLGFYEGEQHLQSQPNIFLKQRTLWIHSCSPKRHNLSHTPKIQSSQKNKVKGTGESRLFCERMAERQF